MRVWVKSPTYTHERAFLARMEFTCESLGHTITEERPDLLIRWGGGPIDRPTIMVECGWLPRSSYQVSHRGINARHHLAGGELHRLRPDQEAEVLGYMRRLRDGESVQFQYADTTAPEARASEPFLLCPFQMEVDANLENVPVPLRSNRALTELIASHAPPYPVWYKQHPADRNGGQLRVRVGTRKDRLMPHLSAPVHAYLKSPHCKGVVTLNSNVSHDALLWDVPVVTLGQGFWPEKRVFWAGLPKSWEAIRTFHDSARHKAARLSYAWNVMQAQWDLEDASNMDKVAEAIERAVA